MQPEIPPPFADENQLRHRNAERGEHPVIGRFHRGFGAAQRIAQWAAAALILEHQRLAAVLGRQHNFAHLLGPGFPDHFGLVEPLRRGNKCLPDLFKARLHMKPIGAEANPERGKRPAHQPSRMNVGHGIDLRTAFFEMRINFSPPLSLVRIR
ncbi:hypothetical protein SDC9_174864 [bioreactor metagenome]|uniref:Uncharacterized protein n=1 Tax=bioreactor metagenome TaxID=1076179 RepID=A0A645GKE1_9ZZZZ